MVTVSDAQPGPQPGPVLGAPVPMRLVLAGTGAADQLERVLAAAGPAIAAMADLPLRPMPSPLHPDAALAALLEGSSAGLQQGNGIGPDAGWLAPLPVDPGLPLAVGGSWAEALGAWRQPTLLLFEAGQLATGWPAAATALLRAWRVPLVGLIQWGGCWDGLARRRDGLPWLGGLGGGMAFAQAGGPNGEERPEGPEGLSLVEEELPEAVALRLRQRWCLLQTA